jgi:hypothetical protein
VVSRGLALATDETPPGTPAYLLDQELNHDGIPYHTTLEIWYRWYAFFVIVSEEHASQAAAVIARLEQQDRYPPNEPELIKDEMPLDME